MLSCPSNEWVPNFGYRRMWKWIVAQGPTFQALLITAVAAVAAALAFSVLGWIGVGLLGLAGLLVAVRVDLTEDSVAGDMTRGAHVFEKQVQELARQDPRKRAAAAATRRRAAVLRSCGQSCHQAAPLRAGAAPGCHVAVAAGSLSSPAAGMRAAWSGTGGRGRRPASAGLRVPPPARAHAGRSPSRRRAQAQPAPGAAHAQTARCG